MLKIKVTNTDTNAVFIHEDVPKAHMELLKGHPNLEVEVLEISLRSVGRYGRRRGSRKSE